MQQMIYVAAAGAMGALCRWGLTFLAGRWLGPAFPYGTLAVNILGSFLLGLVMQIGLTTTTLNPTLRLAVTIGFLGALTTFSTFSYETLQLLEDARPTAALANIAANLALGLAAVWLGMILAELLVRGKG